MGMAQCRAALAGVVFTIAFALGPGQKMARAAGNTPAPAAAAWPNSNLNDDWKGATLDPKWHVTALGDAQEQDSSVKLDKGLLHLMAAGSDTWVGGDNNLYVWQPVNGDFQVTLELHSIAFTNQAAKCGIMVRSSLSKFSPNVFCQAMPKGGDLQVRLASATIGDSDTGPGSGCPGDMCNPWGDPNNDDPNRPVIQIRLTRTGDVFKAERSDDGGKTWAGEHSGSRAGQDTATNALGDDVLVGIAYDSHDAATVGEAVVGPITFTQMAQRPSGNGLLAATAVDANGMPVENVGLILNSGSTMVATTIGQDSSSNAIASDTASFFLKPGKYTIQAGENDTYQAGTPVPLEIKAAGEVQTLKIPIGKSK